LGSVLTSNDFSPLPITVAGIEPCYSLLSSAPITTESTNDQSKKYIFDEKIRKKEPFNLRNKHNLRDFIK
jgi:hypothetical protein